MIYTISEIKNAVTPIAEKYGVQSVCLFGSYARKEAKEQSDIDLLVDTAGSRVKGLFALGAMYCELKEVLQKEIDLVPLNSLQQKHLLPSDALFLENIQRECVPL